MLRLETFVNYDESDVRCLVEKLPETTTTAMPVTTPFIRSKWLPNLTLLLSSFLISDNFAENGILGNHSYRTRPLQGDTGGRDGSVTRRPPVTRATPASPATRRRLQTTQVPLSSAPTQPSSTVLVQN